MHDELLRRALESGKTVSKKAKSKQSSPATSRKASKQNSRTPSRIQSRDVSDDEDASGNLSDETSNSINSIDELLASEEFNEQAPDSLKQELHDRINELTDRKGSSTAGREVCLATYCQILSSHLIADELYSKVPDLMAAFRRSIKAGGSEKETVLALKAIALTAVSISDDSIYDEDVAALLRATISEFQPFPVKAAAIHCLGSCITFTGADQDEITDALTFLLEIISTDGAYANALDSGEIVIAALQVYGFLASQAEDLEADSEDAASAFLEQLESNDPDVQIAAGENIALLYEKTFTPREEDETSSDIDEHDEETSSSSGEDSGDHNLVKRYQAYHNTAEILEKTSALSSLSTHKINKTKRKMLHQSFASITTTIENPRLGLRTHSARGLRVKIYQAGEMDVDTWWKLMRLNALRRLLAGGFVNHYFEGNKQVLDILPIIMRQTGPGGDRPQMASPKRSGNKPGKGRFRDSRRFLEVPE